MANIKDLQSYLPHNQVPIIEETTPLRDVLPHLSGNVVGFIVKNSNKPETYRGYISGNQIFGLVKTGTWKHVQENGILNLLQNPRIGVSIVPMAENSLAPNDISPSLGSSIVHLVKSEQGIEGFLFPDNLQELQIPPKVFYCSNPLNAHPNAMPGRCSSCPFPVYG
jgi:hypothetical protein